MKTLKALTWVIQTSSRVFNSNLRQRQRFAVREAGQPVLFSLQRRVALPERVVALKELMLKRNLRAFIRLPRPRPGGRDPALDDRLIQIFDTDRAVLNDLLEALPLSFQVFFQYLILPLLVGDQVVHRAFDLLDLTLDSRAETVEALFKRLQLRLNEAGLFD